MLIGFSYNYVLNPYGYKIRLSALQDSYLLQFHSLHRMTNPSDMYELWEKLLFDEGL